MTTDAPRDDRPDRPDPPRPHRVADVMSRRVLAVRSDCSIVTAMRSALGAGHQHVVVVDATGRYVGVVSVHSVAQVMFTPTTVRRVAVSAIVERDGPRTRPDQPLADAASEMLDAGVDAIGVVDVEGLLVGLLTWADIVRSVADTARE